MKRLCMMALWVALVAFGAVGATVAPTGAEESLVCDGREDPLCSTEEKETCVKLMLCGVALPKGILTCCAEKEINVDYYYFSEGVLYD